jgi:VCBS repeat-containing protein
LNANGSFTYTPNTDFNGSDSFTYTANDGFGNSNVATVTITVNAVNDLPTAVDDSYTTDEDTPLNVAAPGVLGNDSDPENDPLTAVLVGDVSSGSLGLNADGSFSYTPNANFNGSDSFTYMANDGADDSNVATVTITINPVNDTPVAVDDTDTTAQDTSVTTAVITNDSDVDGNIDPTSITVGDGINGLMEPGNGTVTVDPFSGEITYTPIPGFTGTNSYEYEVCDDGTPLPAQCDVGLVTISVTGAPISVTSIQPNTLPAGSTINVTITGSSFDTGVAVTFENGNGPAPTAADIVVAADGESLTATITAKSGGPPRDRVWDLRLTNPDSSSAVLIAGFIVTP